MDREEAALRAKIQAVRNLLAAKQHTSVPHATGYANRASSAPFARSYAPYQAHKSSNKTWTRPTTTTTQGAAAVATRPVVATVTSANKVWVNANAVRKAPTAVSAAPGPGSFTQRVRSRMQLQMLRLEDGEYAKANGGFSLVRSDVMKAQAAAAQTTAARISAGGCYGSETEPLDHEYRESRPGGRAPCARGRAHQGQADARAHRVLPLLQQVWQVIHALPCQEPLETTTRRLTDVLIWGVAMVVGCPVGYCNNELACKFLHDSRRVALCRKFARGVCDETNCLLAHDKNKMPVCTLFLRGACTRDDCRFRHVKVSGSAQVCEAFLKGYCPQGEACALKHERPTVNAASAKKRPLASISISTTTTTTRPSGDNGASVKHAKMETAPSMSPTASGTSPCASSSGSPVAEPTISDSSSSSSSSPSTKPALSIRPNIRFAPRHPDGGALPSLLPLLRKKQPTPPPIV